MAPVAVLRRGEEAAAAPAAARRCREGRGEVALAPVGGAGRGAPVRGEGGGGAGRCAAMRGEEGRGCRGRDMEEEATRGREEEEPAQVPSGEFEAEKEGGGRRMMGRSVGLAAARGIE